MISFDVEGRKRMEITSTGGVKGRDAEDVQVIKL